MKNKKSLVIAILSLLFICAVFTGCTIFTNTGGGLVLRPTDIGTNNTEEEKTDE